MHALGARVIGVARTAHDVPEYAERMVTAAQLDEVLPEADIVAMALPGAPGTEHIIDGIDEFIDDYDCFLLANHGVLSFGEDIFAAADKVISLEMQLKTACCC